MKETIKMEKFVTTWSLRPLISGKNTLSYASKSEGTPYYEQILIYDGDFPFAVVHMDTFWTRHGNDEIYQEIRKGNNVKVEVTFKIIETDYPDDYGYNTKDTSPTAKE